MPTPTYDPAGATDLDRARRRLLDRGPAYETLNLAGAPLPFALQDEEILSEIEDAGSLARALPRLARQLAVYYALKASSVEQGERKQQWLSRRDAYESLAKAFDAEAVVSGEATTVYAAAPRVGQLNGPNTDVLDAATGLDRQFGFPTLRGRYLP